MSKNNNPNKINIFNFNNKTNDEIYSLLDSKEIVNVSIDQIKPNPFQPRVIFDDIKIEELAESIKNHGIISPLLLRQTKKNEYEILSGERRYRASKEAGIKNVPAVLGLFTDEQMMEISLIENIQREELNFIEEARAFKNLTEKIGLSQEEIGNKIGKSRSYVSNVMRMLELPEIIQEYVINNVLTMGQVKPLIKLDKKTALEIANKAIEEGLSSREIETLVNLKKGLKNRKKKKVDPFITYAKTYFKEVFDKRVSISSNQIRIHYKSKKELEEIIEKLKDNN